MLGNTHSGASSGFAVLLTLHHWQSVQVGDAIFECIDASSQVQSATLLSSARPPSLCHPPPASSILAAIDDLTALCLCDAAPLLL